MTYQQAVQKKNRFTEPFITTGDLEMEIFVIPSQHNDIEEYKKFALTAYMRNEVDDEDAKQFCTNDEFELGGLYRDMRGVVVYKFPFTPEDLELK